ncbi:MAG: hypothetical protein Q9P14_18710 [candidate division KSB1 bacterium]|nr:hypothetical protein [candidate division KSB1 bacterium]
MLQIEKKMAFRSGLWRGIAIGFFIPILLLLMALSIAYAKREALMEWAMDRYVIRYAEDLFAGFPDAYMSYNRDRVFETLDNFTNAVADKKVDRHDFARIGKLVLSIIEDKRISYEEMEQLLTALNKAAKGR